MTLSEFVLSMCDREEEHARANWDSFSGHRLIFEQGVQDTTTHRLHQVEAKRKIVAQYLEAVEEVGEGLDIRLNDDAGIGLQIALRYLAAVYSGEADYREEWKL
jgi:Family of unknown function (DUF6221)